jgi:hypothetical protein
MGLRSGSWWDDNAGRPTVKSFLNANDKVEIAVSSKRWWRIPSAKPPSRNVTDYFDPKRVKWLIGKMETREFVYLKQVMSLVILELWHRVFIDGEEA